MRKRAAFTLIEIMISVFILLLLMLLAVPSLSGVMADHRLHRSLDAFNRLVVQAQNLSINERRPYLLVWEKGEIELRPESFAKGHQEQPTALLDMREGDVYTLKLSEALTKKPPAEWIFWPSGNCEPAIVGYEGTEGTWTARYSALTARGALIAYATK